MKTTYKITENATNGFALLLFLTIIIYGILFFNTAINSNIILYLGTLFDIFNLIFIMLFFYYFPNRNDKFTLNSFFNENIKIKYKSVLKISLFFITISIISKLITLYVLLKTDNKTFIITNILMLFSWILIFVFIFQFNNLYKTKLSVEKLKQIFIIGFIASIIGTLTNLYLTYIASISYPVKPDLFINEASTFAYVLISIAFYNLAKNAKNIFYELNEKNDEILNIKFNKISIKYTIIFSLIGAILGLPLSYYFQSEIIKRKVGGIGGYIKHFDEILNDKDLLLNVIFGIIVYGLIGFIIGYFMDNINASKK